MIIRPISRKGTSGGPIASIVADKAKTDSIQQQQRKRQRLPTTTPKIGSRYLIERVAVGGVPQAQLGIVVLSPGPEGAIFLEGQGVKATGEGDPHPRGGAQGGPDHDCNRQKTGTQPPGPQLHG